MPDRPRPKNEEMGWGPWFAEWWKGQPILPEVVLPMTTGRFGLPGPSNQPGPEAEMDVGFQFTGPSAQPGGEAELDTGGPAPTTTPAAPAATPRPRRRLFQSAPLSPPVAAPWEGAWDAGGRNSWFEERINQYLVKMGVGRMEEVSAELMSVYLTPQEQTVLTNLSRVYGEAQQVQLRQRFAGAGGVLPQAETAGPPAMQGMEVDVEAMEEELRRWYSEIFIHVAGDPEGEAGMEAEFQKRLRALREVTGT